MGIIMGIECPSAHEPFLSDILTRQILPAYQMAKSLSTQWVYHGFTGEKRDIVLPLPTFSDINLDN